MFSCVSGMACYRSYWDTLLLQTHSQAQRSWQTQAWSIMEIRICSFRDNHTRKPFCKEENGDSSSGRGWHSEFIQASVHFSACWRLSWVYVRVCPYVFQRVTWSDKSLTWSENLGEQVGTFAEGQQIYFPLLFENLSTLHSGSLNLYNRSSKSCVT